MILSLLNVLKASFWSSVSELSWVNVTYVLEVHVYVVGAVYKCHLGHIG